MIKTYKFENSEEVIRLLPYLDKNGNFQKSFHIYNMYNLNQETLKCPKIKFYVNDHILNDALLNLNTVTISHSLIRYKKIFFYAFIKDKVELVSLPFRFFEPIYYKISKLIHEGKDPFDPINGIGVKVNKSLIKLELELCEISPISYADNLADLKKLLLDRKVNLSDIEIYELNNHKHKKRIYDFLDSFEPLKDVKWKIRQERLRKIKNNITITHQNPI